MGLFQVGDWLFADICEHPEDHDTKLMYSDWLEESGELDRAAAWRWIGERGRNPKPLFDMGWVTDAREYNSNLDPDCIPDELHRLLPASTQWNGNGIDEQPTVAECYTALESALLKYQQQHGRLPE